MLRLTLPILAFALGAALAVGLISCGGDEEGLLPGDNAQQIVDNLNQVEQLNANGDCEAAAAAADEVQAQIDALGNDVDAQLRQRLADGAAELEQVISDDCVEEATIPTVEPTTEETTGETTTKEKTKSTTTTTTTDQTTTTTAPTTTTQTTTGGGITAPPPGEAP